jgi:hypothetical protein
MMRKAGKTYITFNKIRLALFVHSYAHFAVTHFLIKKYKINDRLSPKELRKLYYNKYNIPEISRLAKTLNFKYSLLWQSLILDKNQALNKKIKDNEMVEIYLSIENEIIQLAKQKQKKSDYFDPDYESDYAILSVAIERAVGNKLGDMDDDFAFELHEEELRKKYTYWYYKIAYKYKLPTIRITPFILRLIS